MSLKEIELTPEKKRFSISLRSLMMWGFGGLVAISIGLVLFISVATNFANTYSLLTTRSQALLNNMERSIRLQTDQAERSLLAVQELYQEGSISTGLLEGEQNTRQQAILRSLLVAAPIIEVMVIYELDGIETGIYRDEDGLYKEIPPTTPDSTIFKALENNDNPDAITAPVWGEPITFDNTLYHPIGMPLRKDGVIKGYVFAAIGQYTVSRIVAGLSDMEEATAFVLTADNKVIGHSGQVEFLDENSNVELSKFPDEVLRQFPDADVIERVKAEDDSGMLVKELGERSGYIFITRKLVGYASEPYTLGAYFAKSDISTEIKRAVNSAIAGLVALIIAVIASLILAKKLSRPMHNISCVANDFSNLKLDEFSDLPRSRVKEIDEQGQAMNSMHTTLSEFSQYVPRSLVKRLMEPGSSAIRSVEREITILFTDITGFTSMTEELNAIETASFLNEHFENICAEITRHNGTIDKFIGDGVMAFWGAPDADNDQALNAINAARDMMVANQKRNVELKNSGHPPLRMRIGIHTGRVVVGNIGSRERQNYTIVGDAVNVANRLEQLGKEHIGEAEAITIISKATWESAHKPEFLYSLGLHKLRGRETLIEVYAMGESVSTSLEQDEVQLSG